MPRSTCGRSGTRKSLQNPCSWLRLFGRALQGYGPERQRSSLFGGSLSLASYAELRREGPACASNSTPLQAGCISLNIAFILSRCLDFAFICGFYILIVIHGWLVVKSLRAKRREVCQIWNQRPAVAESLLGRETHDEIHPETVQMLQRRRHCLVYCVRWHWIICSSFHRALWLVDISFAQVPPGELPGRCL
jgi:hypothetical protein